MSNPRIVRRKPVKKAKRYRQPKKPGNGFGYLIGMIVLLLLANALGSYLAMQYEEHPAPEERAFPVSDAELVASANRIAKAESRDPGKYSSMEELLLKEGLVKPKPIGLKEMVHAAAKAEGIPPSLLHALVLTESGGNPKAISPKGACGLTQLMPATARELGVTDCRDPHQNLRAGAKYFRQQWNRFGDPVTAAIAYNWGSGNTEKWRARGGRWRDLPEETRRYVPKINARMELASLK